MQNTRCLNTTINRMSPRYTVIVALVLGFVVFGSTDLLEQWLLSPNLPDNIRLLHLMQGFLAAAGGMLCVWAVMSKKEQELLRLREQLASQLAERTNDVRRLTIQNQQGELQVSATMRERERLHKCLLQHREDFLAVVDHRLRNPLIASRRAGGLLLQGDFGKLESSQEEIIHLMVESSSEIERCLTMLMDIYSYRNGTKELNLSAVSINEALNEICDSVGKRQGSTPSLCIDLSGNTLVHGDMKQIVTLLSHIIDNAAKHARSCVNIHTGQIDGGMLEIVVRDDGNGMPTADVETIFDRFFVSSAQGGYAPVTGVGLCLCSEIARAHGGRVTCNSKLNEGTTITVTLPSVAA
jgi:signal transduction histidine kinase